jgi:hypothetical protein
MDILYAGNFQLHVIVYEELWSRKLRLMTVGDPPR